LLPVAEKNENLVTNCKPTFTNNYHFMDAGKSLSDNTILQLLQGNQPPDEAIRALYRQQYNMVKTYITQNNGSQEDAQDIFQEAIISFIEMVKQHKFRGESSISTFVYAIARYTWLNEIKKRGRAQLRNEKYEREKEIAEPGIENHLVNRELKNTLVKVIDSLGANCKKILLAFYYENLPMRDILQQLQYGNEQVVRNKKYKCLKQLEQMINANKQLAANLQSILYE